MPHTNSTTVSPAFDRRAHRIVLFGLPDAGKSSLLGALAQAGQTQEHVLNGHLSDLSRGLAELQQRVYEDRPRETLEEVVPYPVSFEPFAGDEPGQAAEKLQAVLVDCDGRVANDLLARRRSLDGQDGGLAQAITQADTLVLVVDASATEEQVEADFREFGRFLRYFEQSRGRRSEVGGLPVFLVLTKCDLLARPEDTPGQWHERIEQRKAQVEKRFRDFLERETRAGAPFGSVKLELWTTAVKRPLLAGVAPRPREPYQVAELFRRCFDAARAFRQRRLRSSRRLRWTLASVTALVAAMIALSAALLSQREVGPVELVNAVARFRSRHDGQRPSDQYRQDRLAEKLADLQELEQHPDFARLEAEDREYVVGWRQRLQAYQAFAARLKQIRPPAEARKEADLSEIQTRLDAVAVPAEYHSAWERTEAVQLQQKWLADLRAIQLAIPEVRDWYQNLRKRGEELRLFVDPSAADGRVPWNDWPGRVDKLLAEARMPRFPPEEKLPGAGSLPGWPEATYATVYRFEPVIQARNDWEDLRQRLQTLRERVSDLGAALGLITTLPGKPPLLQLPADFPPDQLRSRLQRLDVDYPGYADWSIPSDLPDVVASDLRRAAQTSYRELVKSGQEVVLRQLQRLSPDGREQADRWRQLRTTLPTLPELADCNKLALALLRLFDPSADDPLQALVAFLRQDQFDLEMDSLTLQVPDDLAVRPVGKLAVYHRAGTELRTLAFRPQGEGVRDPQRRLTTYRFVPEGGKTLVFRPGDSLWADLPLRDKDNRDMLFTWSICRALTYQFERLQRPPRLHRKDQDNTAGEIAEGVVLRVNPSRGLPRVPDLLPVVRLEKR